MESVNFEDTLDRDQDSALSISYGHFWGLLCGEKGILQKVSAKSVKEHSVWILTVVSALRS